MKTLIWLALAGFLAGGLLPCLMAISPPGITWDIRRLETAQMKLNDVAGNGSGQIIAVGENGVIRVSNDDATSWNTIEDATRASLRSITWTGSRWVAVGGFGYGNSEILTSANGLDWDRCCLGGAAQLNAVAASPGGAVALGGSEAVAFSPDLVSWTATTHGAYSFTDVVWAGSQFVGVGNGGLVKTSPDGITWTERNPGTTQGIEAIAWNGSVMVAVGYDYSLSDPLVLMSSNGIAWTAPSMATLPDGAYLYSITWTGSRFVACGLNGFMLTSPDGVNWSHHQVSGASFVEAIHWDGNRLMAVGTGGMILSSPDAAPDNDNDWCSHSSNEHPDWLYDLAEAEVGMIRRTVVVGDYGAVLTSDDGGQSGSDQVSGVSADLKGITTTGISGKRFIAVGGGGAIISSPDGMTWTPETSGTSAELLAVEWFVRNAPTPPIAIAVGASGTIRISINGSSWSSADSETDWQLSGLGQGVVYEGDPPVAVPRIVAVGQEGTIRTATAGSIWLQPISGTEKHLYGVTGYPGGFIAVGDDGTVLSSSDGIEWHSSSAGPAYDLIDVTWTGSQLVATGKRGCILTSPDGASWTLRYGPFFKDLHAVKALDSGRLMAVGADGIVITSDPTPDFADWIAAQTPPSGEGDPDDDPNGDGHNNLVACGFGIPAVAAPTAADLVALPLLVQPGAGEPLRVRLRAHQAPIADLVYIIETSTSLHPGSWVEVLRHLPGQRCSSGGLNVTSSHSSGFVIIEFPETIGSRPSYFVRTRVGLLDPP